jgi:hypothetical protein
VLRAYLDDGNDGFLGQTDPSLLDAPQAGLLVTVDGADVTRDLTLPSGAAVARVAALHRTGLTWQVKIDVVSNGKLPVLATVTSGPGFPVPADLGVSNVLALQLGHLTDTFDVSGPVPAPGDAYEVAVTYADGTSETLTASVDQVLSTSPTPVAPIGWAASLTPTFTWSAPSTPPAGAWATFVVVQQHVSGAPAVLSPPLPSTQTSWTYAGPPLLPGMAYDWLVQAVDASGDTATSAYPSATFTTP